MSRRSVLTSLAIAVVALMTLTGVILAVLFSLRGMPALGATGRIAVLDIDGIIEDDRTFLDHLRRFRRDGSVRGYLVQINSPGGAVGPSQSIFQALRRVREEDDVPVVAAISSIGASGGYYIAMAADSIFALPGSLTGSIGVIMEIPDASALMDRVGVRWQVVKSAEHKDAGSPFRPLTSDDREILESVVLDVYGQFVDAVAEARAIDRQRVEAVADGRVLSGRQALGAGLVDRLGNRDDALATAGSMAGLGEQPRTIRPPADRFRLFDLLLARGAAVALAGLVAPLETAAVPRIRFVVPW